MSAQLGIIVSTRRLARRSWRTAFGLSGVLVLSACGSDSRNAVTLTVTDPGPDAVLDYADDTRPGAGGFQYTVLGQGTGLRAGTPVDLYIDGEQQGATAELDEAGVVTLEDVTLPPGTHTIHMVTSVGSVTSDAEQQYTLRAVVISSPADGEVLTGTDDEDPDTEGFQANVIVRAYAVDLDQSVALLVDGTERATLELDDEGRGTFEGVTLTPGDHTLRVVASAGDDMVESAEIDVTVSQSCADVSFVSPVLPSSGDVELGGSRCQADGSATTTVEVESDASDGSRVELLLDGDLVAETTVTDSSAVFEDVAIPESGVSALAVRVRSPDGGTCVEPFPAAIVVDCEAPSCAFAAPTPVEYENDDGSLTFFLGRAQRTDGAFDIAVQAGEGAEGEVVTLTVDDVDELSSNSNRDALALFAGVQLAEGSHTVRAQCRDAAGNVTSTPELEVEVDTEVCQVSITDPGADALILSLDDEVSGASGVQIVTIATVAGDDCVGSRVGLCDADGVLPDGDFESYDGSSPFLSTVTLDDSSYEQHVCFEISDRAGNIGRDAVAFVFRADAPTLEIENPIDGEDFNALGDGSHTADADRSAGSLIACDGEVWVACTELGTDVELHRDDESGALFASGECATRDSSDPELPDGFAGRAKIVAQLSAGDDSSRFVATQTLEGATSSLLGVSGAITVSTDCELPALEIVQSPCTLHASGQITLTEAAAFDVVIADTTADIASASLTYANDTDSSARGSAVPTSLTASMLSFQGLDLGTEGNVTVEVAVEDDFANVTTYTCVSEIVDDLPQITSFTQPLDGAVFGPRGSTCDTGNANEYGIHIVATIDQNANREASLYINGALADASVTIDNTSIDLCVAIPDDMENVPPGGTEIRLRLGATMGTGFDLATRTVHVNTLDITAPVAQQVIVSADDCDPGLGFGYAVSVAVDPIHNGAGYSIDGGSTAVTGTVSGSSISRCVPFVVGGDRRLTVAIDGTTIAYSVEVVVVDDTPVIAAITAPADNTSFDVDGQTCPLTSGFGVLVTATVDQSANREADILVNGVVVADNVTITGQSISTCVAVPDNLNHASSGASTITLNLHAVVGAGPDATASVNVNVDTLDITDPLGGAIVTSATDCDPGLGFGYQVVVNVDPSLNGTSYTLAGGSTLATGTVIGGAISRCVALDNGAQIITASIDGTGITESVAVTAATSVPTISVLTTPANNASFGIGGQTCSTGVANQYGVLVTATVDQSANREADIYVNDVLVADNVTITGQSISHCVAVPDNLNHAPSGASTIRLRLDEEPGPLFDEATATINVNTIEMTDPVAGQTLGVAQDCVVGAGFGYNVTVLVDSAHNGLGFTLGGGSGDIAGTIAGGTFGGCVALADGARTIAASIDGTTISDTVAVNVHSGPPTGAIVINDLPAPGALDARHRDGVITATWTAPTADAPGQFGPSSRYELRCDQAPVNSGDSQAVKDAWWTAATPMTLPGTLTPDDANPSAPLTFRVEEPQHCVVRAYDIESQPSPIAQSTNLTVRLRQLVLSSRVVGGARQIGIEVQPLGDINGDGFNDIIAVGSARAEIYFGSNTGFSGTADVVVNTLFEPLFFGLHGAAIGNFNGDQYDDFAIVDQFANTYSGRAAIFFGRPTWPAVIDLTGGCQADLCLNHIEMYAYMGEIITAIGDFDGDAIHDLAIGSMTYPGFAYDGQVIIVRGGQYEVRACLSDVDCRASENCSGVTNTCQMDVPGDFWRLEFELPTGNFVAGTEPPGFANPWLSGFILNAASGGGAQLGYPVVGLGTFDAFAGADIAIGAQRANEVHYLSGRAHSGTGGFNMLTVADLGLRNTTTAVPDTFPITTGSPATSYGFALGALGNFYTPSTAILPGKTDIAASGYDTDDFYVASGEATSASDPGFSTPDVRAIGPASTLGQSICSSLHPTEGLVGDLDGDGIPELCVGTFETDDIVLWYSDTFAAAAAGGAFVPKSSGYAISFTSNKVDSDLRNVQLVGDVTGDGAPDIVVGDPSADGRDGQAILLY